MNIAANHYMQKTPLPAKRRKIITVQYPQGGIEAVLRDLECGMYGIESYEAYNTVLQNLRLVKTMTAPPPNRVEFNPILEDFKVKRNALFQLYLSTPVSSPVYSRNLEAWNTAKKLFKQELSIFRITQAKNQ